MAAGGDRLIRHHRAQRDYEEEQQLLQRQIAEHDTAHVSRVEPPVAGVYRVDIPDDEHNRGGQHRQRQPAPTVKHADAQEPRQRGDGSDATNQNPEVGKVR